jgi:UrcA family protein
VDRRLPRSGQALFDSALAERHSRLIKETIMISKTWRNVSRVLGVRALLTAVALTLAASMAHAQPADMQTLAVKSSDLNLATPEGNRTLYHRIVVAAEKVCSTPPATGSRLPINSRSCVKKAIAQAVKATKSAQLAEMMEADGAIDARS